MTEPGGPAWRQTIFHPFALTSRYGRGTVLRARDAAARRTRPPAAATCRCSTPSPCTTRTAGALTVFAVNRDQDEPMAVDLDLRGLPALAPGEHTTLAGDDPDAVNDAAAPDRVTPRQLDEVKLDGGRAQVVLPPLSWNMVRFPAAS